MKKFALLLLLIGVAKCQRKTSPCPSIFSYDTQNDSNDVWYGTIKLQSSVTLHSITVDIIFDRRVENFGAHHFNPPTSGDNVEFRIENKNFLLQPGRILVMKIFAQYRDSLPLLKQIRLNGQNVCVDLPIAAVQPIYSPASSNSHNDYDRSTTTTTKRSVIRENPNVFFNTNSQRDGNRYPTTTTESTVSWNNYGNSNDYDFGRTSSTTRRSPSNNNQQGGRATTTTTLRPANPHYGQESPQRRPSSDFDSYHQNSNSNHNSYPSNENQRPPLDQRYTTESSYTTRRTNANSYTTKRDSYFPGDLPFFNGQTTTHSILNLDDDDNQQCGTIIPKTNPLIVHGLETYHGNYPWHTAIYLSEIGSLKYICGGSLITMSSVITAAHCVTHSKSKTPVQKDKLLVYLGKHNLQKWTGHEQDGKVIDIIVNEEYDYERFYSDIAILRLKETLKRTNYVRPVCLWVFDTELRGIVDKLGNVPGWGYNENGLVSDDLTYVQMPVVTHETCIWSNRDFFSKVTSDKSFCAGFRNGTTICNGDSGGGMVFKKNNKWYLRGVVSVSIALQNSLRCDPESFAVFIDAAKYLNWINNNK